jgi:mono/diheme cytochrome c family protein
MRTPQIRLVAGAFALAFLLLAAAAAWVATRAGAAAAGPDIPPGEALDGRAAFERHCAGCHAAQDVAPETPATGAAVVELLRFLETHGAGDPGEDLALTAYLLGLER